MLHHPPHPDRATRTARCRRMLWGHSGSAGVTDVLRSRRTHLKSSVCLSSASGWHACAAALIALYMATRVKPRSRSPLRMWGSLSHTKPVITTTAVVHTETVGSAAVLLPFGYRTASSFAWGRVLSERRQPQPGSPADTHPRQREGPPWSSR